ncbi:hypothetical protein AB0O28_17425 [Microbispora sp. NPDC088329]|uniref:hypothetical protein n=1 Tax=Microbispora sp. NPDC088329 TaxID=3154869 RepID=UPI00342E49D3
MNPLDGRDHQPIVSRPSTALTLCDGTPAHALALKRHTEPALNSPLLGVPILNCDGNDRTPGIWFFSLPPASPFGSCPR